MNLAFRLLICVLFVGCSTVRVADTPADLNLGSLHEYFSENELQTINCGERSPANAESCEAIFDALNVRAKASGLSRAIRHDDEKMAEIPAPSKADIDKTVPMTDKMKAFREKYLRFFTPSYTGREALVQSFESSLRMRSKFVQERLKNDPKARDYDLVIVGTGVHGILALHEALKERPEARILLVDEGDTGGATFRYGKDFFNINSSNRASDGKSLPLPGQGNLNELPGLPIQVSDMTAVKYPSANDLGSALVTALYAAVREYPNVNVLFNANAHTVDADNTATGSRLAIRTADGTEVKVDQKSLILTTGLGKPDLPELLKKKIEEVPALQAQKNPETLPRVVTFEDMVRIVSQSDDPRAFFANKRFAVVGNGDSANVTLEYALGLASREAYGNSSAQAGRPEKILWIGQTIQDCAQFITNAKTRSRYIQIGKGFQTSDPNFAALLSSTASRLTDVNIRPDGKLDALLAGGAAPIEDLDFVILTTGSQRNVRKYFENTSLGEGGVEADDDAFLGSAKFSAITGTTTVSRGQRTKVGIKYAGRNIYVLGTAAGNLTRQEELVGVLQNSVSIFNNAPRVVSATRQAVEDLPAHNHADPLKILRLEADGGKADYRVTGISGARLLPGQTLGLLRGIAQESLLYFSAKPGSEIKMHIQLKPNGELRIENTTDMKARPVIELLAQTREFFALAHQLLKNSPNRELVLEAHVGTNGRFDADNAKLSLAAATAIAPKNETPVRNAPIKLRGVLAKDVVPEAGAQAGPDLASAVEGAQMVFLTKAPLQVVGYGIQRGEAVRVSRDNYEIDITPVIFDGTRLELSVNGSNLPTNLPAKKIKELQFSDNNKFLRAVLEDGETLISNVVTNFSRFGREQPDGSYFEPFSTDFTPRIVVQRSDGVRVTADIDFRKNNVLVNGEPVEGLPANPRMNGNIISIDRKRIRVFLFDNPGLYEATVETGFKKFTRVPEPPNP